MFHRHPFTFGLGLAVVFYILASWLFLIIAVALHWESHTHEAKSIEAVATFFGSIASFIPSVFWTYNPSDSHSFMPFWFRPLMWLHGFIIGAFLDLVRHAKPKHAKA